MELPQNLKTGFEEETCYKITQVGLKILVLHLFLGFPKNQFSNTTYKGALVYWRRRR